MSSNKYMNNKLDVCVLALGRSTSGEKFAEVRVKAYDEEHVMAFSVGRLGNDECVELFAWIEDLGLPTPKKERQRLKTDILEQLNQRRLEYADDRNYAIAITHVGWNGAAFATKYRVHAPKGQNTIVSAQCKFANDHDANLDMSMDAVREFYKRYGKNNALFKTVSCLGFVPPLLSILKNAEQPIFVLVGKEHRGKSSLVTAAASLWGGQSNDALGFISSMSATENSIEAQSAAHRDLLFALDDVQPLSQNKAARAQALASLVFRIHSGRTRGRLNEEPINYRNAVLGASNETMTEILMAGAVGKNGALLDRIFELPCKYAHDIFDWLPAGEIAEERVRSMKAEAIALRGAAGEWYAEKLVKTRANAPKALSEKLENWRKQAQDALDPRYSPRSRDAFACVFSAGCLAHEFGILPWKPERLLTQIMQVFDDHVKFTKGGLAKLDPVKSLNRYVRKKRSHFISIKSGGKNHIKRVQIEESAGIFNEMDDGTIECCFLGSQFAKVFKSADERQYATNIFKAKKLVKCDKDGKLVKRKFGSMRPRVYCFDAAALKAAS